LYFFINFECLFNLKLLLYFDGAKLHYLFELGKYFGIN